MPHNRISQIIFMKTWKPQDCIITVCDDSLPPDQYLSYLTYVCTRSRSSLQIFRIPAHFIITFGNFPSCSDAGYIITICPLWHIFHNVRIFINCQHIRPICGCLRQLAILMLILFLKIGIFGCRLLHNWEKVKTIPIYIPIVREMVF